MTWSDKTHKRARTNFGTTRELSPASAGAYRPPPAPQTGGDEVLSHLTEKGALTLSMMADIVARRSLVPRGVANRGELERASGSARLGELRREWPVKTEA